MTEIPEHLLKRSKERRAAMGEGGGDADTTPAAAGSTPGTAVAPAAPAAAAKPAAVSAPAAPPPPKPVSPQVAAARSRKRIPFWAMSVLAALPIWMFIYADSMSPNPVKLTGPLAEGAEVYSGSCSSCHSAGGEGGVGPKLSEGEVLKNLPSFEAHYSLVTTGSAPYAGSSYGEGLRNVTGAMPPWKANGLTAAEIMGVVCHERFTQAGITDASVPAELQAEFDKYCAPEATEFVAAEEEGAEYPLYASPPDITKK